MCHDALPTLTVMNAVEREKNLRIATRILLEKAEISMLDMARIILELHEALPDTMREHPLTSTLCRRIIRMGANSYLLEEKSVTFSEAVEKSLLHRAQRRGRTLAEIRQCSRRFLRYNPALAGMSLRSFTPELCRDLIMNAYCTPTTQRKARRLLHTIFAYGMRMGWCGSNPVLAVEVPSVRESRIEALTIAQVHRLLRTVRQPEHLPCAPAVGFMLWAGIRPTEVTRLRWQDVRIEDHVILIAPHHSKTGGARQVPLYPVLAKWLQETAPFRLPGARIVPCSWVRRWHELREAAGFAAWHPDTLRHTFASYHLKHFNDLAKLQLDMGHADIRLLRTRYLGMAGVTGAGAREFWGAGTRTRRCNNGIVG